MSQHCQSCGAPLKSLVDAGRLRCDHCGNIHLLRPANGTLDRVHWLGHPGEYDCPVCRGPLASVIVENQQAEGCPRCHGLLLQDESFATVVASRRAAFRGLDDLPRAIDPRTLHQVVACPGCDGKMEVHPYYGPGNIVIDSCHPCGLVWLDGGELTQAERAPGIRAARA
jgi:Zn-finger nucleic acid-binding protein/DNA-directed RNA polymerase subunit RPC12/RpoP